MRRLILCLPLLLTSAGVVSASETPKKIQGASPLRMRVVIPVADLRSEPKDAPTDTYAHDPLQESQILFGEDVLVHEISGEWARVEVERQREYTHKKVWEGYPGWVRLIALEEIGPSVSGAREGVVKAEWAEIRADASRRSNPLMRIPFGSRVEVYRERDGWCEIQFRGGRPGYVCRRSVTSSSEPVSSRIEIEAQVWRHARSFLGDPYYWGGLSPYSRDYKNVLTGVDCSGLTHLSYRAANADIPRDSHEQWMTSAPLRRKDLRRGDLVFVANAEKPQRVVHVAMYVGGEFLIEGPGTGLKVHRITFKKKFGRRLSGIESGDTVGAKVIYFGRPTAVGPAQGATDQP